MKRPSDSAREPITWRPRCRSSRRSTGAGSRCSSASSDPAIDLIGPSELPSSWPMTRISRCQAWRSSSRSGRLTSDEHQQVVLLAAEAEGRAAHFPPADAAGHGEIDDARRLAEPVGHAQLHGRAPEQLLGGAAEQPLAGAVHQPQPLRRVEGEHRDVDLLHHRPQQRGGLDRAEPLLVQRLGQRVDLGHDVAERIAGRHRPPADREVVLAHRGDEVGQRLQRRHDVRPAATPGTRRRRRRAAWYRPLHLGGVVAGPQQDQRRGQRRQRRAEGQGHGVLIEAKPVHR